MARGTTSAMWRGLLWARPLSTATQLGQALRLGRAAHVLWGAQPGQGGVAAQSFRRPKAARLRGGAGLVEAGRPSEQVDRPMRAAPSGFAQAGLT